MDLTKKSALDTEKSSLLKKFWPNRRIVATFLKDLNWYGYWMRYVESNDYKKFLRIAEGKLYDKNIWYSAYDIIDIFGCFSLGDYLKKSTNISINNVLHLFVIYLDIFHPELADIWQKRHPRERIEDLPENEEAREWGLLEKWNLRKNKNGSKN